MLSNNDERLYILKLVEAKKDISSVLRSSKLILDSLKETNVKISSVADILEFAENNTPTAYAPKGWAPGCPVGHPPAPRIEQMRLGLLGSLGVSLGLTITSQSQVEVKSHVAIGTAAIEAKETNEMDTEMDVESENEIVNDVVENSYVDVIADTTVFSRFQRDASGGNANAVKKPRFIDMNYGFDSSSSSEDEDDQS